MACLFLRPQRTQEQAHDDSQRNREKPVERDDPCRFGARDEQDNGERNRGETICRPLKSQSCRQQADAKHAESPKTITPRPKFAASKAPTKAPKAVPASRYQDMAREEPKSDCTTIRAEIGAQ
jgi:hypothetical protein